MNSTTKLIVNLTSGESICVGELADKPWPRIRSLIGRRGLQAGEGLLLTPAPSANTAFLRFPIDALFLDRHLRVLKIVERLQPWRVASKLRTYAVLELPAGESARRGLEVGHQLGLREHDYPAAAGGAPTRPPHALELAGSAQTSESIIWPSSLVQHDEAGAAAPMRVVVVSSDRHFRKVALTLLSDRGCAAKATAEANRVAQLIDRGHADVIVIDAGLSDAHARSAALAALTHRVGIVVVGESPAEPQQPLVLPKWGPFDDLFGAIAKAAGRPETE